MSKTLAHQLTSALSSLSLISSAPLLGDENCIELRDRSHLCYKSIINYDLDITNILVVSPQVRYIEVFDITNPKIKSRFHCKYVTHLRHSTELNFTKAKSAYFSSSCITLHNFS